MSHERVDPKRFAWVRVFWFLSIVLVIGFYFLIESIYKGYINSNTQLVEEISSQRDEIRRLSEVVSLTNVVELTNVTAVVVTNKYKTVETNRVIIVETNDEVVRGILENAKQ